MHFFVKLRFGLLHFIIDKLKFTDTIKKRYTP